MNRDKQDGIFISKESVDKLFPKKDIDILGYESPINVIMGQIRVEYENNIYKAIQDYRVDVDKEELIKALQYDRDQYVKGYINGYNAKASDVAREIFAEIEKNLMSIDVAFIGYKGISTKTLDELKKKYESEGKG